MSSTISFRYSCPELLPGFLTVYKADWLSLNTTASWTLASQYDSTRNKARWIANSLAAKVVLVLLSPIENFNWC